MVFMHLIFHIMCAFCMPNHIQEPLFAIDEENETEKYVKRLREGGWGI